MVYEKKRHTRALTIDWLFNFIEQKNKFWKKKTETPQPIPTEQTEVIQMNFTQKKLCAWIQFLINIYSPKWFSFAFEHTLLTVVHILHSNCFFCIVFFFCLKNDFLLFFLSFKLLINKLMVVSNELSWQSQYMCVWGLWWISNCDKWSISFSVSVSIFLFLPFIPHLQSVTQFNSSVFSFKLNFPHDVLNVLHTLTAIKFFVFLVRDESQN